MNNSFIKLFMLCLLVFGLLQLIGCGHVSKLNNTKHFNKYSSNRKGAIYLKNGEIWDATHIRKVDNKIFWSDADTAITHNCNANEVDKIMFNDKTRGAFYGAVGTGCAALGIAFVRSIRTSLWVSGQDESLNKSSSAMFGIGIAPAIIIGGVSGAVVFGLVGVPETFIYEE